MKNVLSVLWNIAKEAFWWSVLGVAGILGAAAWNAYPMEMAIVTSSMIAGICFLVWMGGRENDRQRRHEEVLTAIREGKR